MKKLKRLVSILMVAIMFIGFGFSPTSIADGVDVENEISQAKGSTYENDIAVSSSNGMEYRTIKDLDLRSGNSDTYDSIVVMEKGSLVKHLGTTDNDWFKLEFDGEVGYAHRTQVTSKANYDANYKEIAVSKSNGRTYRTIKDLDLRTGNSDKDNSILLMPKGSLVKHLGTTNNDWFKLECDGKVGYAHRTQVTSQANYDANYKEIGVSKSNGRTYRTIKDLDLRSGNSNSHSSLGVKPRGSLVKHLGTTSNDWFKLECDGEVGYIHRTQVTSEVNYNRNYDNIKLSPSDGREYMTNLDLYLRTGDSYSDHQLFVIPRENSVKHLGTTDNDWFKVEYKGVTGYIHRTHLRAVASSSGGSNIPVPKNSMVFLDYGHGGIDPGAIGTGGRYEKDDALRIGLLVAKQLRDNGVTVDESRTGDVSGKLELSTRTAMANRKNYDYFVSIHRNAFNGSAYGVETFSHPNSSQKAKDLSSRVQRNLVNVGYANRGAKHANFQVLRQTRAPAILIEVGFIDNANDNWIFDSKLNQLARAITDGILSELARN